MDTKTYQITEKTCYKTDCKLKFNVVTSSIDTVVATPVEELDFKTSRENTVTTTGTITDYIVVTCPSGHTQSVFLTSNKP
ncbi:hypothetical protein [Olleya aquimaris]|uniref:Uncharacterized protein n=1 Tax=Olleya aquimaris TaxID=639310 RepID=A0A327RWJ6_9FLAO|nr:hypothetical protein [Olleya aquimaris]RAJ17967.1 hypothetical protein LY08_00237 [Olleya aquimaris]